MDALSSLSKDIMQLKDQLGQALQQVRSDSELIFDILECMRKLIDWKMRWESTIERADENCYREMISIVNQMNSILGKDYVKSRIR